MDSEPFDSFGIEKSLTQIDHHRLAACVQSLPLEAPFLVYKISATSNTARFQALSCGSEGLARLVGCRASEPLILLTDGHADDLEDRVTVSVSETGLECVVIGDPDQTSLANWQDVTGLPTDFALRVLGLSTPKPGFSPAHVAETRWLQRLVDDLTGDNPVVWSWQELELRHPLHGPGPVPDPLNTAVRTMRYEQSESWERLLRGLSTTVTGQVLPAGLNRVSPSTWFDEGSLARWSMAGLSEPEDLKAIASDLLSPLLYQQLLDSWVTL